ncbi:MAG: hydrolase 1, exosortase A system-associated [Sphingomonadales bacterium]|nr:hydrolase 1, exosortase A system-associated [Sphingomonadales bacterium]
MSRRHISFACEGATLVGTLDTAEGTTGLLWVSGGNELRSGAWAGQALLAAAIAAAGFPVLRFDRRGVGDSAGPNGEFRSSAPDIAAALARFRAECPRLARIVGFGNCDGASALMLAKGAGLDALALSNPWTIESEDAPPPPEAIRDHYQRRLADPAALLRLLSGKVSPGKLAASLRDALRRSPPPSTLARDLAAGIADFAGPIRFFLAERDRTAQAFLAVWDKTDARIRRCPDATHSYVEPHARDWLAGQLLAMLRA